MKLKWKRRLIAFLLLSAAVIAFVEFEKWMKRRSEPCISGICPIPHDHGLAINPFPSEIVPQGTETNQLNSGAEHE